MSIILEKCSLLQNTLGEVKRDWNDNNVKKFGDHLTNLKMAYKQFKSKSKQGTQRVEAAIMDLLKGTDIDLTTGLQDEQDQVLHIPQDFDSQIKQLENLLEEYQEAFLAAEPNHSSNSTRFKEDPRRAHVAFQNLKKMNDSFKKAWKGSGHQSRKAMRLKWHARLERKGKGKARQETAEDGLLELQLSRLQTALREAKEYYNDDYVEKLGTAPCVLQDVYKEYKVVATQRLRSVKAAIRELLKGSNLTARLEGEQDDPVYIPEDFDHKITQLDDLLDEYREALRAADPGHKLNLSKFQKEPTKAQKALKNLKRVHQKFKKVWKGSGEDIIKSMTEKEWKAMQASKENVDWALKARQAMAQDHWRGYKD